MRPALVGIAVFLATVLALTLAAKLPDPPFTTQLVDE
jgi:hypothetical protein